MTLDTGVQERVFLVGCPRSGTTLLQSMIAAHPSVASFPESKLFLWLVSPGSRRSQWGLAAKDIKGVFTEFLQDIGREDLGKILPKHALFMDQYAAAFIELFDTLAIEQGKSNWLEKTPQHLRCIDYIEKLVPQAKFIHIVRNGASVVASLYQVSNAHPEIWGGTKDIAQCIELWCNDVKISTDHLHKSNHHLVRYEQLVEEPQSVLEQICQFINLPFDQKMLRQRTVNVDKLIRSREHWKAPVTGAIKNPRLTKFKQIFTPEQRQYILARLSVVDINKLEVGQKAGTMSV